MRFTVLTLFPEMFDVLKMSIIGKALERNLWQLQLVNIRDYSSKKNKNVDDYAYGGSAGMIIEADVVYKAYLSALDPKKKAKTIFLTPQGEVFNQKLAVDYSKLEHIILICGHYQGVDQRLIDKIVDEEVSLGNFVVTGGELPAMILIDAVLRLLPNTLGNAESLSEESFSEGILECPNYTRPRIWEGLEVPEILLSGHHENIKKWRRRQSIKTTFDKKRELLSSAPLTKEDIEFVKFLESKQKPRDES